MRTGILAAGIAASLLLPAPAHAAFPGTNGRIAFQSSAKLDTINASGGDRRTLVGPPGTFFSQPAWSADGQRLVFVSNREGGTDGDLYVIGAAGGAVTPLTSNASEDGAPSWSPDGRRIAFASDRDTGGTGRLQLYVMNADGTGVTPLSNSPTDDTSPTWSPDGTQIAFARGASGGAHTIWVTPSTGGLGKQLTTNGNDDDAPDWSPNGGAIVFERGTGIARMAAGGSGQTPVAGSANNPVWSPDGTRIAFERDAAIVTVGADGSAETPLTTAGTPALLAYNPSWQPIPIPAPPSSGGGTPPPPLPGVVDADGDGVAAGLDCNDSDPAIRPGAKDVPGDKIDQDCAGGDARARLLGRSVVAYTSTYPARRYTTFTTLTVKPVRKGDRLKLTCKGGGCPLKAKTIKVKKNAKQRSLLKYLKHAKLRDGAVMRLRVTRKGTVGRVATWNIRASKPPKVARKCAAPGKKKLTRCPRS